MISEGCGEECAEFLRVEAAVLGVEVHVSTSAPLAPDSPYPALLTTCPHGVKWYAAPTSEQIAAWAAEGIR